MNKRKIILSLVIAIVLLTVLVYPGNLVTASVKGPYVPILIYHHFDPAISDFETMKPSDFEKQIAYLHKAGYHAITVSELATFMSTGNGLPKKPIMITIDDGYESNYQYAYPVLKKYKMKATIFVIAERIGKDKQKPPRLTWEQCKEMYDSGLVDIQSHTFDLHHKVKDGKGAKEPAALTRIKKADGKLETKEEYAARVHADILKSKEVIERNVGNTVTSICYPFGAYNEELLDIVKKAGFTTGFTTTSGVNTFKESPLQVQRILVGGHYRGKNLENAIRIAKGKDKMIAERS